MLFRSVSCRLPQGLAEVGILPPLLFQGADVHVAGKDLEVPLQLSQAAQGGQHLGHAAAGEVRPPAGPGKEGVPAKEQIAAAEGDAALGVAGGVKDLDFYGVSPEGDPGPLVVNFFRRRW